jgi:hypothetical protein
MATQISKKRKVRPSADGARKCGGYFVVAELGWSNHQCIAIIIYHAILSTNILVLHPSLIAL